MKRALSLMQRARYATLVTVGDSGQPQARIADPRAPESDMTIWVATNPLTRKVNENTIKTGIRQASRR